MSFFSFKFCTTVLIFLTICAAEEELKCCPYMPIESVEVVWQCDNTCPSLYYFQNVNGTLNPKSCLFNSLKTAVVCQRCQRKCQKCREYNWCDRCDTGYFFVEHNSMKTCHEKCPDGYESGTPINGTCRPCRKDCLKCHYSPSTGDYHCDQCQQDFYLLSTGVSNECVPKCTGNYFADEVKKICLKCHNNCSQCSMFASNCTKCEGSGLLFDPSPLVPTLPFSKICVATCTDAFIRPILQNIYKFSVEDIECWRVSEECVCMKQHSDLNDINSDLVLALEILLGVLSLAITGVIFLQFKGYIMVINRTKRSINRVVRSVKESKRRPCRSQFRTQTIHVPNELRRSATANRSLTNLCGSAMEAKDPHSVTNNVSAEGPIYERLDFFDDEGVVNMGYSHDRY